MTPIYEIKRQFIARPDESKDQILFKWPDRNIRIFSQLTVQQDEVAVFFKDGKVFGSLGPGRHNLNGKDIPFIGALIDALTGGDILISELYFVSVRQFTSLPFGGKVDTIEEPTTKLFIDLRMFGEYAFNIHNPENLILCLVGTQNLESNEEITNWIKSQIMKVARQLITTKIRNREWDVIAISQYNKDLETSLIELVNPELEEYGIRIQKFGNITVNISDEDAQMLKQYRRDTMYASSPGAADAALKVGVGKGMEKGGGSGSEGLGLGVGIAIGADLLREKEKKEQLSQNTDDSSR